MWGQCQGLAGLDGLCPQGAPGTPFPLPCDVPSPPVHPRCLSPSQFPPPPHVYPSPLSPLSQAIPGLSQSSVSPVQPSLQAHPSHLSPVSSFPPGHRWPLSVPRTSTVTPVHIWLAPVPLVTPPPQPPVRFSSSQSIPAPPVCLGPRQPTPVHPIPQPLSTPARRLQYPRPPAGSAAAPLSPASSGGAVGPPRAGARAPAPGPGRASALPGQAGCLGPYLGCPGRGGGGWLRGLGARRQLGGARGVLTPGLLRGQPVVAAVLLEGEGVGRLGEADLGAWRGERG